MRYCSNYFLWIESYGIFLSLEEISKDRNSQNLQFNVFRHIANISRSIANFANFDCSGVRHRCENYWYPH